MVDFTGDKVPRKLDRACHRSTVFHRSRTLRWKTCAPLSSAISGPRTPHATAEVIGNDGAVPVSVERAKTATSRPVARWGAAETVIALTSLLGSPTELAEVARDPDRAEPVVRRLMASAGYREVQAVESWSEPGGESTSIRVESGPLAIGRHPFKVDADPLGLTAPEVRHQGRYGAGPPSHRPRGFEPTRAYRAKGYSNHTCAPT